MDDQINKPNIYSILRESWTNNICTIVLHLFQQSFPGLISLMDIFHRGIYRIVFTEILAISTGIELGGWVGGCMLNLDSSFWRW
jgi:hypothetical protein